MVSLGQKFKMLKTWEKLYYMNIRNFLLKIIFDEVQKSQQIEYTHARQSQDKGRQRSIGKKSAVHSLAQDGAESSL